MTKTPESIANEIKQWDRQSVARLRGLIAELNGAISGDDHIERHIDMTDLPTADIPDDVDTSYPVWAMDVDGNMLTGECADEIMTIAEYRADR